MHDPHLAALETTLVAEDWSGMVEVCSALDGRVTNSGVARYRDLRGDHLVGLGGASLNAEAMALTVMTRQSQIRIAETATTRFWSAGEELAPQPGVERDDAYVAHHYRLEVGPERPLRMEKVAAIYTSRDDAISEPALEARKAMTDAPGYATLAVRHVRAWSQLWQRFDLAIEHDDPEQGEATERVLRLHLEVARFWASVARYEEASGRYEIRGVMGPDEYHEAYPGADHPGLDNNAYTNLMAVWVLVRALELREVLPRRRFDELCRSLELSTAELELWDNVSRHMLVPFHGDGIISQFAGYEDLEEFDWAAYRERYGAHRGPRGETRGGTGTRTVRRHPTLPAGGP